MFAVLMGMCLINTFRLFALHPINADKLGLTADDLWLVAPRRAYNKALAIRRAQPLAGFCISIVHAYSTPEILETTS